MDILAPFVKKDLDNLTESDLSDRHRYDLLQLLNEYRQCFASNVAELGTCGVEKMNITLVDEKPVTYRPYRLANKEREEVRKMVSEMLEHGIIRESNSPYGSHILLVKKKKGVTLDYESIIGLLI